MDLKAREVVTRGLDELGLFDKSGNVWEWCEDWHHSNYDALRGMEKPGANWRRV